MRIVPCTLNRTIHIQGGAYIDIRTYANAYNYSEKVNMKCTITCKPRAVRVDFVRKRNINLHVDTAICVFGMTKKTS